MAPTPERYKEIQQALTDRGHYTGPVNGIWGPESVAALKSFQQEQNLTPDGKLGALSLIALGLGPKREPASDLSAKPETPQPTDQQ
jgi:peptidoglycan hydrolase-like protein with peptidoglycan-binding domain